MSSHEREPKFLGWSKGRCRSGLLTLIPASGPAAACGSLHGTPTPTSLRWPCSMTRSVYTMSTGMWGPSGQTLTLQSPQISLHFSLSSLALRGVLQFLGLARGAPSRTGCVFDPDITVILSFCPTICQSLDGQPPSLWICLSAVLRSPEP